MKTTLTLKTQIAHHEYETMDVEIEFSESGQKMTLGRFGVPDITVDETEFYQLLNILQGFDRGLKEMEAES